MAELITLKLNSDFRRVYSRGKSVASNALVIYYLKNRTGKARVGITTSRKIGNAVERNRSRRVIKEGFRKVMPKIKTGYDYVLVARSKTKRLKSTDISSALLLLLSNEGLILPVEE